FTITSVTWSYTNPEDAVETFTPAATSTTPASNKVTVKYNPANLIGNTNIDATGIQVVITATIVATSAGACPTAVYTVSRTVTIKNADCCTSVFDAEGNFYYAHQFGDAGCWMTENLKSTYNDIMPLGTLTADNTSTSNATKKYYYFPNKNSGNKEAYGLLYTWAAATNRTGVGDELGSNHAQTQGICPAGWHVPSDYEWGQLEKEIASNPSAYSTYSTPYNKAATFNYTGTSLFRPDDQLNGTYWGRQMKSQTAPTGSAYAGTSNSASDGGFDAIYAGLLKDDLSTFNYNLAAHFWTATSNATTHAIQRVLSKDYDGAGRSGQAKGTKQSIRCIKSE
ncbi:MAG: fibrobacter succinogenes major paralogous domain-containing protein, partial [Candidatus Symbiothrix sp.]|nr:fibrobacter succinogenes major paralogous domain-containing protein [Candidatus Symbiothrix sp.]